LGQTTNGTIAWPITQQEIADAIGLSDIHVNRVLQELRGKGLITLKSKQITVHDWDRLRAVAQFTPDYLFMDTRSATRHLLNLCCWATAFR
jgi:hypothetical protein